MGNYSVIIKNQDLDSKKMNLGLFWVKKYNRIYKLIFWLGKVKNILFKLKDIIDSKEQLDEKPELDFYLKYVFTIEK